MSRCCLYYTCNTHDPRIEQACRVQLDTARGNLELGTVSREPIDYGDWNIVVDAPRSPLTMHKQILAGLQRLESDQVFLCESDVLYHPSHFTSIPLVEDVPTYNTNVWKVRWDDGHAVWTDNLEQVSGCCAPRELLLSFYERRVYEIERDGFNRHYEPGPKTGIRWTADWVSLHPNIDIRHKMTLTRSKWSPDDFRNKRYAEGWKESDYVEPWGDLAALMQCVKEGRWNDIRVC